MTRINDAEQARDKVRAVVLDTELVRMLATAAKTADELAVLFLAEAFGVPMAAVSEAARQARRLHPSTYRAPDAATLTLPDLIRKHSRETVAEAAGISSHMLAKLRTVKPEGDPNRRRLTEDHLSAWVRFDPEFSPDAELARRARELCRVHADPDALGVEEA